MTENLPPTSVTPMGGTQFRVRCPEHGLDRTVDSAAHAANIEALHIRMDHGDGTLDLNLTAAAQEAIKMDREAAWTVWQALLGMLYTDGYEEIAYVVAAADPPIMAHIPPYTGDHE